MPSSKWVLCLVSSVALASGISPGVPQSVFFRSLTVDHTQTGSVNSSQFPVLVSFTNAAFKSVAHGGHVNSNSAADVLFFSDSGRTTQIPSQIDFYDPVNGVLVAWVQVATLSVSVNTVFYVSYGNPSPPARTSGVWSNGFSAGVWHFANGTSLSLVDASGNGNNGTNASTQGTLAAATGQIDGGASLSGGNGQAGGPFIHADGAASGLLTGDANLSAWVNLTPPAGEEVFYRLGDPPSDNDLYLGANLPGTNVGNATFWVYSVALGDFEKAFGTSDPFDNVAGWHYIVGNFISSSNTLQLYVDGALDVSTTGSARNPTTSSTHFTIGGDMGGQTPINGLIDEARASNVSRSASWILSEYNNQKASSTFLTLGSEQQ